MSLPPQTGSAAKAPYSNVRRYCRPQHAMRSPVFAVSGRAISCSQSGHETVCAMDTTHRPPSSLSLRDRPAQLGHGRRSPDRAPGGTARSCPQSGQRTVGIASDPEQALQPPAIKPRHHLSADDDDGHRHSPGARDQFGAGFLVLGHVLGLEWHALLRKELFRVMTRASARGPVDGDGRCPHSSSFVGARRLSDLDDCREAGLALVARRVFRRQRVRQLGQHLAAVR